MDPVFYCPHCKHHHELTQQGKICPQSELVQQIRHLNLRREILIDKRVDHSLSRQEEDELNRLQRSVADLVNKVAPLPTVDEVLRELPQYIQGHYPAKVKPHSGSGDYPHREQDG